MLEALVILEYLGKEYVVASPDYEGPYSAFIAGRLAGMGVLDGMRAVQSFKPLGLASKPKIFGSGYSVGAIATEWAASLASQYVPDLNIVGWAMGGTPSNLTGTFTFLHGFLFFWLSSVWNKRFIRCFCISSSCTNIG